MSNYRQVAPDSHRLTENPPHILVVDDDPQFVQLVNVWLKQVNYRVTSAFSGEEALEALRLAEDGPSACTESPKPIEGPAAVAHPPFDLVLLDVMMPGLRGTEVCRRIRANGNTAQLPVLVLTALTSPQERIKALEAGANDFISKPFHGVELLTRIENLVRWRRAELETQARIRQRNRELDALNQIAHTLNQTLNLTDLLERTLATVCRVTGLEWGAIHLLDPAQGCLELAGHRNAPPEFLERNERIFGDDSPPWSMSGQMLSDVVQIEATLGPYTCVPLTAKGNPVGLLTVSGGKGPDPTLDWSQLLGAMGHQIGATVENARLYAAEQEQVIKLKALTQELERSRAHLIHSEKLAAAGRLAASLAHEINNPLQAVHNCLALARNFSLEAEEHTDFLKLAEEEVQRLIGIVHRILEFCRPSQSHRIPTDIKALIEHVVALTKKKLEHSDITLRLDLTPEIPPVPVVADQISQVILNLVVNAIEAMPNGGTLEIAYRPAGEWVEVNVRDDGPGLDQQQIEQLFEPFFTTKPSGTGLGLAISFGVVERHGGTIQVASTPGCGSTFTVRLPVATGAREKEIRLLSIPRSS